LNPPIQNSKFTIQNYRSFSEGKSASWRSWVCDERWAKVERRL